MKSTRKLALLLVVLVPLLGLLSSPASGTIGVATITTPPIITTTTFSPTSTTTLSTTSTTTSTSFSTTVTSSSTTTTSSSTSFSYTSTYSTTTTLTNVYTSYTSTVSGISSTFTQTTTTSTTVPSTTTSTEHTTVLPSICPVALVTAGTALEPFANFLRGFRDNQIQSTTAGHNFMLAFNGWYYDWAPSVAYMAASNPWFFQALRVGVYPLIGILYASYYTYALVSPLSGEAGAIMAGVVAASLIGLVYVAPVAYLGARLVRRRIQFSSLRRAHEFIASGWLAASALIITFAYMSGSGWLMGLGTASLTLSMLSVSGILGAGVLASVQMPLANQYAFTFVARRMARMLR